MSAPSTIHGHPVVGHVDLPKRMGMRHPSRVILADVSQESHKQWVTAIHIQDDREWLQGHYYNSWEEALLGFFSRVRRHLGLSK